MSVQNDLRELARCRKRNQETARVRLLEVQLRDARADALRLQTERNTAAKHLVTSRQAHLETLESCASLSRDNELLQAQLRDAREAYERMRMDNEMLQAACADAETRVGELERRCDV